jgi:hypothetical protein
MRRRPATDAATGNRIEAVGIRGWRGAVIRNAAAIGRAGGGEVAPIIGNHDCQPFIEPRRDNVADRAPQAEPGMELDMRKLMCGDLGRDTARRQNQGQCDICLAARPAAAEPAVACFGNTSEDDRIAASLAIESGDTILTGGDGILNARTIGLERPALYINVPRRGLEAETTRTCDGGHRRESNADADDGERDKRHAA